MLQFCVKRFYMAQDNQSKVVVVDKDAFLQKLNEISIGMEVKKTSREAKKGSHGKADKAKASGDEGQSGE